MAIVRSASRPRRSAWCLALVGTLALTLAGCGRDASPKADATGTAAAAGTLQVSDWPLPALQPGSGYPDLAAAADGRLLLLWTHAPDGRRPALQFAAFDPVQQRWQSAPRTVAVGNRFFVNWADTPHILATPDGALWVHWLQKHGDAPGAYDIMLATSRNGGMQWSAPVVPHDDGTASEHGFVSMWARGMSGVGLAWLDGREVGGGHGHGGDETVAPASASATPAATSTATDTHTDADTGTHTDTTPGTMTLRTAAFDGGLARSGDALLDASVCDCCQTDAALTARGPLVAYRGRTAAEVRDIHVVRGDATGWTAPRRVHADDWTMPACPVNGPAIDATGNAAVVAWYTVDGDTPVVRAARSDDAGDSFAAAVELDRGTAVHGRVDIALEGERAWVLWLREDGDGQSLWLSLRSADLATEHQRLQVAAPAGRGRGTGFPRLVVRDGVGYVVWTDLVDGSRRLRGARIAAAPPAP